ncbi:MAG: hypothetical protein ABIX01_01210 [Chitinophagaceae bacterium]
MDLRLVSLVLLCSICSKSTKAQPGIPERKVVVAQPNAVVNYTKVLSAVITNDSIVHSVGSIPYHHFIKAKITSIGTGVVHYKWEILDDKGAPHPASILTSAQSQGTVTLGGTGYDEFWLVLNSNYDYLDWTVSLGITAPNSLVSKPYTYH